MMITQETFIDILTLRAKDIDRFLSDYLVVSPDNESLSCPQSLMAAMRYGALNGGKRLRPFLMNETVRMLGGDASLAIYAACGLECLHCYSLIHDDLPAMDDDDLRRGKPTVHKVFDEAAAILAGDSLLTLAFELTAHEDAGLDAQTRVKLVQLLARDAGKNGMVGGQQLDIEHENKETSDLMITRIHNMKTGALIRYACEAGAIIAKAPDETVYDMRRFGEIIGLAFQLSDDLLDVTADEKKMGKATGKDADAGKSTLIAIYGVDWARKRLDTLVLEAEKLLYAYGERGKILNEAAHFIAKREF